MMVFRQLDIISWAGIMWNVMFKTGEAELSRMTLSQSKTNVRQRRIGLQYRWLVRLGVDGIRALVWALRV